MAGQAMASRPRNRNRDAFQGFCVEARRYWMSEIWGELKAEYRQQSQGKTAHSADDVAAMLEPNPLYWYYAWLERHIQRAKYSGRWGLAPSLAHEPPERFPNAQIKLDPSVPIPQYYAAVDIHQHPGNLHGAPGAGAVYKASAGSTQPGATAGYELHERFAQYVERLGRFDRILDMGCGFGKSALPLATRFSNAMIKGVDLAAPCLELAAAEAVTSAVPNLAYEQADARHTPYDEESFDLVTSTMVLHELDEPALRELFRETYRLLEPGGTVVHLDFQVRDPFLEFIHLGHSRRNNEPYMRPLNKMDVARELTSLGFTDIRIEPFEEADGATRPEWPTWRFPWMAFVAKKPAAANPSIATPSIATP